MPPAFFTLGAAGDVLTSIGAALVHPDFKSPGTFLHFGWSPDVTEFLIAQDFCSEAFWIRPANPGEYRITLRNLAHNPTKNEADLWPAVKRLFASSELSSLTPDQVRLVHFRSRPPTPLPVCHWHGAKLPKAAREWAQQQIIRDGRKNLLLCPFSFASCKLSEHWPNWRAALSWLHDRTEHRCYLVGQGYGWPAKTDGKLMNLIGHAPSIMHVFALADLCDGIIATSNSFSHWAVIREKPAVICCNRLCSNPAWFFRRWLDHPQVKAIGRLEPIGAFVTAVTQKWGATGPPMAMPRLPSPFTRTQFKRTATNSRIPSAAARAAAIPEMPSITKQTPWPCGIYDFPNQAANCLNFNCSLVEWHGADHLVVRKQISNAKGWSWLDAISSISLWRLENNVPVAELPVSFPEALPAESNEDPKAFIRGGKLALSWGSWRRARLGRFSHQNYAELGDDLRAVGVSHIVLGNNGKGLLHNRGYEKNWSFFEHDGHLFVIYTLEPMMVCRIDGGIARQIHRQPAPSSPWKCGTLRGGSPPVRVADEYFGFFHSSMDWRRPYRRYFMGAYAFEAKPPFKFRRITPKPLLVGSAEDPRPGDTGPIVVFPNGALLRNDEWLVVGGLNDCRCFWIRIPHGELLGRMVSL